VHKRSEDVRSAIQGLRLEKVEDIKKKTIERIDDERKIEGKLVEAEELLKKLRKEKLLNITNKE